MLVPTSSISLLDLFVTQEPTWERVSSADSPVATKAARSISAGVQVTTAPDDT
jgi:hypothetical protein